MLFGNASTHNAYSLFGILKSYQDPLQGSKPPTDEWLCTKAKPLIVRREKVRDALVWLQMHNPLYSDIVIDHDYLNQLECEFIAPMTIEFQKRI